MTIGVSARVSINSIWNVSNGGIGTLTCVQMAFDNEVLMPAIGPWNIFLLARIIPVSINKFHANKSKNEKKRKIIL